MKEGVSINKLDTKLEKLTFVGFLDRPCAVQFYDTRARSVKTSHNFRFLKDPVSTPEHLPILSNGMPREGELRPGDTDKAGSTLDTTDRIESRMEWIRVSKRKRADDRVSKSGCWTSKKPATGRNRNRLRVDCSCQLHVLRACMVAVALLSGKLKRLTATSCNQSFCTTDLI